MMSIVTVRRCRTYHTICAMTDPRKSPSRSSRRAIRRARTRTPTPAPPRPPRRRPSRPRRARRPLPRPSSSSCRRLLFRQEDLNLEAQLPVRTDVRRHRVVESLDLRVHREPNLAYPPELTPTAAYGDGPRVAGGGRPVGRHDRSAGEVPALAEVVVQERLDQHLLHVLVAPAGERPLVVRRARRRPMGPASPAPRPSAPRSTCRSRGAGCSRSAG